MINRNSGTLLLNAAATGASPSANELSVLSCAWITAYIHATAVTSGATIKIEGISPNGDWTQLTSNAIAANGDTVVQVPVGSYERIRANITARTDGTYTVTARAHAAG